MRTPAQSSTHHQTSSVSVALALVLALLVSLAPGALAQVESPPPDTPTSTQPSRSLNITHGPVVTTLVTSGSDGHQLGDLRVVSLPVSSDGSGSGRLDASLLTTGIDQPEPGDEIRISTLVFTLGEPADQVVVSGSGVYPAAGSTIALDSTVVRPIVGASGRFAGITGWAESEHLADDTWRHSLHFVARPGLMRPIRPDREQPASPAQRPERLTPTPRAREVVRTLLAQTEPDTAPGKGLGLWHYVIPSGVSLPAHLHPGHQVARIVRGVLTYEVISGEAEVVRSGGLRESVGPGGRVMLVAGDSVVESPGMVHAATNAGRRPVEIISATLFETGAPPSSLVEDALPEASVDPATRTALAASSVPAASPVP
jgi:quercetin dioxygenase-like cupin family protein